ncbi:MAG: anion permease [Bacteroidales bacterium]|nr:anion permease [Bacteroidales bacterium]
MELLGLDWHAWLTIALILGMFITMMKTKIPADVVFLSVMALLVVTGCLPAGEALSGFSSTTVVVVGALFVVVAGLDATGVLHWVVQHLLGTPSSYGRAIVRLMVPVAGLSAFLSNTTVVALFIKVVKVWASKLKIAPSKLLIPLSYAAGMGGVCTLIGTPPNLIISSFYADATGNQLGIFSTTVLGLACLAVGVICIIAMQKLLPERKSPEEELTGELSNAVHYLFVPKDCHIPGQTLGEIGLLSAAKACTLVGVVHFDGAVDHVDQMNREEADDVLLMGSDTLIFTGNGEEVAALGKRYGMKHSSSELDDEIKGGGYTLLSTAIMLGMVLLSAFNVLPLLDCTFIAALLMLVTRCCTVRQAKKSINWDVLMVFASSVALGKAIDHTGLAQLLADNMAGICGSHALVAFIIICTIGTFLTEFVSNTACGAILAPVAIKLALTLGVNPLTFCMGLMVSVSSSFATPIGSPTHLMVYVPGGYRFSDFLRIGLPMNFIILATNIIVTLLLFPL